jgi:hypothetical protein
MGDADSELTAVFRDEDLPSSETTCGVEDSEARPPAVSAPGREIRALRSPAEAAVLRLACDADLEFYAANDLQTIIQIGDVIVRTADPDPYTTTNPTALLVQERTDWTAHHGDIARNAVQQSGPVAPYHGAGKSLRLVGLAELGLKRMDHRS